MQKSYSCTSTVMAEWSVAIIQTLLRTDNRRHGKTCRGSSWTHALISIWPDYNLDNSICLCPWLQLDLHIRYSRPFFARIHLKAGYTPLGPSHRLLRIFPSACASTHAFGAVRPRRETDSLDRATKPGPDHRACFSFRSRHQIENGWSILRHQCCTKNRHANIRIHVQLRVQADAYT